MVLLIVGATMSPISTSSFEQEWDNHCNKSELCPNDMKLVKKEKTLTIRPQSQLSFTVSQVSE